LSQPSLALRRLGARARLRLGPSLRLGSGTRVRLSLRLGFGGGTRLGLGGGARLGSFRLRLGLGGGSSVAAASSAARRSRLALRSRMQLEILFGCRAIVVSKAASASLATVGRAAASTSNSSSRCVDPDAVVVDVVSWQWTCVDGASLSSAALA
jgi:hypothetical protein